MNIIIPMAGMGKRMRPHTLTVPKPLIPIAGKPIVYRLVEDIAKVCGEKIDHIGFVVGHFGEEVEQNLLKIAQDVGATGSIHYQEEPLGTAHAILCAKEWLTNKVVIAFADTLFKADFQMDTTKEGVIWVQHVADPSAYGVIQLDKQNKIVGFVEKPKELVSNLAIIGIYYFKDGAYLKKELEYLLDHNIKDKGEYQLTNALENMNKKGVAFSPVQVTEWLDCGNKTSTVLTNKRYLDYISSSELIASTAKIINSVVIPPVFLADDVKLENAVVGPYVSVGKHTIITNSRIQNSIIQEHTQISDATISNSMIGNHVKWIGKSSDISVGDYTDVIN